MTKEGPRSLSFSAPRSDLASPGWFLEVNIFKSVRFSPRQRQSVLRAVYNKDAQRTSIARLHQNVALCTCHQLTPVFAAYGQSLGILWEL